MNSNLNQNQKPEQKLKKSQQLQEQLLESHLQQPGQHEQQRVATYLLHTRQQVDQKEQYQEKLLIKTGLTAEKLKEYPGLAGLTDSERENIAESLILFSQLTYELFQNQPAATISNND